MADEMEMLRQKVASLEIEIAERRPVERQIQFLMYFLAAISALVGLFGFKQLSDVESTIAAEVKQQFPKDSQKYLEYQDLIEKTSDLNRRHQELFGKYESALKTFASLDKVSDDFDIEGKVRRVIAEADEKDEKERLTDEQWRINAVATLQLLSSAQKKKNFNSDFIFNASQTARQLHQDSLAAELMEVAHRKRPMDAPILAGKLSAIVNIGDEAEVNQAFYDQLEMIRNLDANSPHIVLSEAWNSAEELRRYGELVKAIDDFLADPERPTKPSYVYFLKAYALTRSSREGDMQLARASFDDGTRALMSESPNAVWFNASLRQMSKCREVFEKAELLNGLALLGQVGEAIGE